MKKKIIAAGLAALWTITGFAATKPQLTYLEVINHWNKPVHVKEGLFATRESDIAPGGDISWLMISGTINNLSISSQRSGSWQQIPGCASGYFTSGVKVYIIPAPWNPDMPMCQNA